nr:uncharacterized protein LOC111850954 [Paramormyrops kingsleyae]
MVTAPRLCQPWGPAQQKFCCVVRGRHCRRTPSRAGRERARRRMAEQACTGGDPKLAWNAWPADAEQTLRPHLRGSPRPQRAERGNAVLRGARPLGNAVAPAWPRPLGPVTACKCFADLPPYISLGYEILGSGPTRPHLSRHMQRINRTFPRHLVCFLLLASCSSASTCLADPSIESNLRSLPVNAAEYIPVKRRTHRYPEKTPPPGESNQCLGCWPSSGDTRRHQGQSIPDQGAYLSENRGFVSVRYLNPHHLTGSARTHTHTHTHTWQHQPNQINRLLSAFVRQQNEKGHSLVCIGVFHV